MFPTQAALKIHAQRTHKHIDKTDITFNKALHSVGGLPTCRFCNKKFSRWQTLSQHITANRCPKHMPAQPVDNDATYAHMPKNPADPGIPVQINDEPHSSTQASPATCIEVGTSVISQQTGVVAAASTGLNSFIRLPAITSRLMQTCALCGQWNASHRTMKRHYQYSHADVLTELGGRITALIQRTATACPTCHFCHVRRKDWREHIMKCTVIFQCAVMCLMQQERPRVGVGPVLRGGEIGGEIGGGSLQTQKATARTLRVPGTVPIPRSGAPRVLIADFFGQASCSAGGGAQDITPGPCSDLLHEAGRAHHVGSLISHSSTVLTETKQEPSLGIRATSSEGDHGGGCLQRAWSSSRTGSQRGGILLEGQGARMAGSCGGMAVPLLGQCGQAPGGGQIEKAAHRSGGVDSLADLQKLVKLLLIPELVHCFGCKRKLSETMEGTATFLMDLSTRTPQSLEAWHSLLALQGCTVLQLGGIAYRKESSKPSPGIAKIKEMIRSR